MAPQILNRELYTKKADSWAFGVLFLRLLTGMLPYKKATDEMKKEWSTTCDYWQMCDATIEGTSQNISQSAKEIIKMCLQYEESDRCTINELAQHKYFDLYTPLSDSEEEYKECNTEKLEASQEIFYSLEKSAAEVSEESKEFEAA